MSFPSLVVLICVLGPNLEPRYFFIITFLTTLALFPTSIEIIVTGIQQGVKTIYTVSLRATMVRPRHFHPRLSPL